MKIIDQKQREKEIRERLKTSTGCDLAMHKTYLTKFYSSDCYHQCLSVIVSKYRLEEIATTQCATIRGSLTDDQIIDYFVKLDDERKPISSNISDKYYQWVN